jgi:glycosyltransferase involved in cell wall biosynthesis
MVIFINSVYISGFYKEQDFRAQYEYFNEIASLHPHHRFIYLATDNSRQPKNASANMTGISAKEIKNPLSLIIWCNYQLPRLLKKHRADLLINLNCLGPVRSKIPCLQFVTGTLFLHHPGLANKKQIKFEKKNTPLSIDKASAIITYSEFTKQEIIYHYKTINSNIYVIPEKPAKHFRSLEITEKNAVREKYTEGREYFLFSGNISQENNLMNLLKAFSLFKKRQKSNMQLVIASVEDWGGSYIVSALKTYKYRDDVQIITCSEKGMLEEVTAAAYCFVYPVDLAFSGRSVLQVMQCEVPVIASLSGAMPEICGEAAEFVIPDKVEDIADKMMLLFKDETRRNELIEKGKQQLLKYDWDHSMQVFWNLIEKTAASL